MKDTIVFKEAAEATKRDQSYEQKKEILSSKLREMFWERPVLYLELVNYCGTFRYDLGECYKKDLIELGFLFKDGSIPDITKDVVYDATN
ncbi:hypothetical protein J5491_01945 [Candidatus Saccharibacteria bacterium]|nr:hypothetical protein [Candidatus Saccharibacteria bacterium]